MRPQQCWNVPAKVHAPPLSCGPLAGVLRLFSLYHHLQLALESSQEQGSYCSSSGLSAANEILAFVLGTHHPYAHGQLRIFSLRLFYGDNLRGVPELLQTAQHVIITSTMPLGGVKVGVLKAALYQASFAKSAPTRRCLTVKTHVSTVLTKTFAWVVWSCLFHATPRLETPECKGYKSRRTNASRQSLLQIPPPLWIETSSLSAGISNSRKEGRRKCLERAPGPAQQIVCVPQGWPG